MRRNPTTKPASPNCFRGRGDLWRILKRELPKPPENKRRGRPRIDDRRVINGIWYVLWARRQWKAEHLLTDKAVERGAFLRFPTKPCGSC